MQLLIVAVLVFCKLLVDMMSAILDLVVDGILIFWRRKTVASSLAEHDEIKIPSQPHNRRKASNAEDLDEALALFNRIGTNTSRSSVFQILSDYDEIVLKIVEGKVVLDDLPFTLVQLEAYVRARVTRRAIMCAQYCSVYHNAANIPMLHKEVGKAIEDSWIGRTDLPAHAR